MNNLTKGQNKVLKQLSQLGPMHENALDLLTYPLDDTDISRLEILGLIRRVEVFQITNKGVHVYVLNGVEPNVES